MKKIIKIQLTDIYKKSMVMGREPENNSIFTDYCRRLIKDGEPGDTRLEAYRGDVLCLIAERIAEAAKFTVRENKTEGPKWVRYVPMPEEKKQKLRLGSK